MSLVVKDFFGYCGLAGFVPSDAGVGMPNRPNGAGHSDGVDTFSVSLLESIGKAVCASLLKSCGTFSAKTEMAV